MGLYLLLFLGGTPLGSPLAGWIAETLGPRMSMIAGGLVSVVATAVIGVMLARSQGAGVREYLRPGRLARMVALLALGQVGTTPLQRRVAEQAARVIALAGPPARATGWPCR